MNHRQRPYLLQKQKLFPKLIILVFILALNFIYANVFGQSIKTSSSSNTQATQQLYELIQKLPEFGIAFGHQDATAYGVNWKDEDRFLRSLSLKSDVKSLSGQLPAILGFDLGHLELDRENNLDTVSFALMKNHIQRAYKKGAIITISWHPNNPVSGGSSWDTTPAVSQILVGGKKHNTYKLWIYRLSEFFKSLTDKKGELIPVVFRPFHEMNGSWFWWGAGHCSSEEYKQLWRETSQMLTENEVNNLLYAYSPNTFNDITEFNNFFPGNQYVDILGVDVYNHGGDQQFMIDLKRNLALLKTISEDNGKPYVLAESGNIKKNNTTDWWTQVFYQSINDSGIAWFLVWRNANTEHYFASYHQDTMAQDFKNFAQMKEILFLKDLKKIQRKLN